MSVAGDASSVWGFESPESKDDDDVPGKGSDMNVQATESQILLNRPAEMSECNFNDSRIDEGIALFNAGEFFACHDVLEDFWGELTCPEKPFFQGLIQAAVALYHFEEGNHGGARRMARSCCVYLRPFVPSCGGIDVERLLTDLEACFQELLEEHASYPAHLKVDPEKIPKIYREAR